MASSRGRHVARHRRRRTWPGSAVRPEWLFVASLGLFAAAGTNKLTGVAALDVVERFGLGVVVAVATWRHGPARQSLGLAALGAALLIDTTQGLGGLVLGAGIAALVLVVLADAAGRRVARYAALAAVAALLPAGALALTARNSLNDARAKVASLRTDLTSADSAAVTASLDDALAGVRRARSRLNHPAARLARAVPFAGQQLVAARDIVASVEPVVTSARAAVGAIDIGSLKLDDGRVPVDRLAALQGPAASLAAASKATTNDMAAVRDRVLVPPLNDAARAISREATSTARSADLLARFAGHARDLFGANGTRRYFLLVQNPAEARAAGGILGAYAEITVTNGKLDLATVGRDSDLNELSGNRPRAQVPGFERHVALQPKRYWQNFTASPDFPTVARVIEAEYAPIARPVNGVISVDPAALAALLRIAGPVRVAHWPEPLSADNVEAVLQHDQYVRFQNDFALRELFMAEATGAIWKHATGASLQLDRLDELAKAVEGGHIALHAVDADEQDLFARAGLAGGFPQPNTGDVLAVTTQATGINKLDWFLTRTVTYEPRIDGDRFAAKLTVTMRNDTPRQGEPPYIAGPADGPIPPGHNRSFVSIYTPWEVAEARIDGGGTAVLLNEADLGMRVYSTEIDIPPGGQATLTMTLRGTWRGGADAYRLAYRPQSLVKGDSLRVIPGQGTIRALETRPTRSSAALRWYGSGH